MGQKPPRPVKPPIYMPGATIQSTLPPPTNLTTQDIMDLPILFADDNKLLEPTVSGESSNSRNETSIPVSTVAQSPQVHLSTPKLLQTVTPGKFMLINKPNATAGNVIITSTIKKQNPLTFNKPPPKYTKIILSAKKHNLEELKPSTSVHSETTMVKLIPSSLAMEESPIETPHVELIDLENEIKATAVPKPNASVDRNLLNTKEAKEMINKQDISLIMKRPSEMIDDGDPDYVPPKNLKLE